MPRFEFGKYKDCDYVDVPESYFIWLINDCNDKILMYKAEIERRKVKVEDSAMAAIVNSGHRELSKVPGNDTAKLNRARDALMRAITEAAQP